MPVKANVIGYYVHEGNLCAEAVHVIVDNGAADTYSSYNPVHGVGSVSKSWVDLAFRITKEQYIEAAGTYQTPVSYL